VLYFLIATNRCNLACRYCGSDDHTFHDEEKDPWDPIYSLDQLLAFLDKDEDPRVVFYGGEPLLNVPLIEGLMKARPSIPYTIQTNATKLHRIPDELIPQIQALLVSIDGRPEVTDSYRGEGVTAKIFEELDAFKARGYNGTVVGRMAISENSDAFTDVSYLLDCGYFDMVHWQLDAIWSAEGFWEDITWQEWMDTSYLPGLERLMARFMSNLRNGKVDNMTPITGVLKWLLDGEHEKEAPAYIRCGSGYWAYAIYTTGALLVCPICPDWSFAKVGHINEDLPSELPCRCTVDEPCPSCDIYTICGGRCLFSNKTKLWGDEGFELVCTTIRKLVDLCKDAIPEIEELILKGVIERGDIDAREFTLGLEIIP